jgi:hypothetical protein
MTQTAQGTTSQAPPTEQMLQDQLREITRQLDQLQSMTVPPPPTAHPNPYGPIDPDAITAVFLLLSLGIIIPISAGITRRLWRRPQPTPLPHDAETVSKARLDRLEQAVDAIAIEIERISEGQRFVTRVLTERPASVRPSASDAPDSAALAEGTPFLALGAGPMEPIPLAQRQPVKQSITPH